MLLKYLYFVLGCCYWHPFNNKHLRHFHCCFSPIYTEQKMLKKAKKIEDSWAEPKRKEGSTSWWVRIRITAVAVKRFLTRPFANRRLPVIRPKPSITYWKIGNRLEGVDRKHPSLICVATVIDVNPNENQVTIHFDGWSALYDYTANVQSTDLHPIGFCEKNQHELQKPKGHSGVFEWTTYLGELDVQPVPHFAFHRSQKRKLQRSRTNEDGNRPSKPKRRGPSVEGWEMGQRLEALDRKNPHLICVATITEVDKKNKHVLIHFDGWTNYYDYWTNVDSTDLHPVGYCEHEGRSLEHPRSDVDSGVGFVWQKYLNEMRVQAVPNQLFTKNERAKSIDCLIGREKPSVERWTVGQRLEAKDRKNPQMICVATVAAVDTVYNKVKINFDGWGSAYDYTTDVDNVDLHPVGYCEHARHQLQIPYGYADDFHWSQYLDEKEAHAVPHYLFTNAQKKECPKYVPKALVSGPSVASWTVGQRLEAKDRLNPSLICVATIKDVDSEKNKVTVTFDGWTARYDYRTNVDSVDLHPIGYCQFNKLDLQAPNGYNDVFDWSAYLHEKDAIGVPHGLFNQAQTNGCLKFNPSVPILGPSVAGWKVGQRLEAKDRLNPSLICVATVKDVDPEKNKVTVTFDGWTDRYDYRTNVDSSDLHPIGYCENKNLELQAPKNYQEVFKWSTYLGELNATAVPAELFYPILTE